MVMRDPTKTRESVQAALARVLQSRAFSRSKQLRRFLEFTVTRTLEGREEEVKEYTIAVEAYGRGTSHDPRLDPVIRNDAQRLRKKLASYYEGEGSKEAVRFVYPKGSYVPAFVRNGESATPEIKTGEPARTRFQWLPVAALVAVAAVVALSFWLAGRGGQEATPRVAVLPFDDFSQGQDQKALALATTEALIARLSREPGLDVVSRTTAMRLEETERRGEGAAARLGADYVVEGSFQRSGQRCRLTAQLVRVDGDTNIWAQQYSFDWSEVLEVQAKIADEVAAEIGARVVAVGAKPEVSKAEARVDPEAYEFLSRARYALYQYGSTNFPEYLAQAKRDLERALEVDPDYTDAIAEVAYYNLSQVFPPRPETASLVSESRDILTRSLRIDPDHVRSLYLFGQVEALEGRTREALESTLRAVELDPDDAEAHGALALRYAELGFYEASLKEIESATARNSRWALPYRLRVDLLLRLQRYEEASQAVEELHALNHPGPVVATFEATLFFRSGELGAAEATLDEAMKKYGGIADTSQYEVLHGLVAATSGNVAEGRLVLEKYRDTRRHRDDLPNLALVLGEPELALAQIERTPMARNYRWLATNPYAKPYLDRPDFRALAEKLHQEWRTNLDFLAERLPAAVPSLPELGASDPS